MELVRHYTLQFTLKSFIYFTLDTSAFDFSFLHPFQHLLYQLHVEPISLSVFLSVGE
jgi:hypothetical protein